MTGFNLPPGCSVSDIPGNRPDDQAAEALAEALYGKLTELGVDVNQDWVNQFEIWFADQMFNAYSAGYQDGVAEEKMATEPGEDR